MGGIPQLQAIAFYASVSVFGLVKAFLAYKSVAATALNAVDYFSGVALVSL